MQKLFSSLDRLRNAKKVRTVPSRNAKKVRTVPSRKVEKGEKCPLLKS
jgi:hypothetical protein